MKPQKHLLLAILMLFSLSTIAQYYIDYQIRTDDLYARAGADGVFEGSGSDEVVWRYKAKVSSTSSSGSYSSLITKKYEGLFRNGLTKFLSTSVIKSGICLDNADNVYVFIEGWEDDNNNTTFDSGDDDYRSDTDYDLDLSANTRNIWVNFNSNDNSGDFANAGTVGADNGDYRVEIDTWWNWSLPVNPNFSITNKSTDAFDIELGSTNNYRVTSWDYQVSTTSDFTNLVASGTATSEATVTGLSQNQTYYVRIRGKNEAGTGSYTSSQTVSTAKVIYVRYNASGANDGTSWTDAYTSLHTAITNANEYDHLWVGKGSYHPNVDDDNLGSGIEYRHFSLKEGLKIYGGFAGTETSTDQRVNYHYTGSNTNRTIIDGLGYLEVPDPSGMPGMMMQIPYNCYHLFYHDGALSNNTLLDGLAFMRGNADKSSGHEMQGGAIFLSNGGNITINQCYFLLNQAGSGGAIYASASDLTITNSTFKQNDVGGGSGGAIFLSQSTGTTILNSLFYWNDAGYAGAVYNSAGNLEVINSTFTLNDGTHYAGAIESVGTGATLTVKNSILWNNTSDGIGTNDQIYAVGTNNYYHCNIEGSGGSASWISTHLGTDGGGNIDANPKFVGSSNNSTHPYSIAGNSPCKNSGNNSYTTDTSDIRIDNNTSRINYSTVDMGAYEYNAAIDLELLPTYVNASANGIQDGNSWTNAFTSLQDALDEARPGDQIWVAKGTYKPSVDSNGDINSNKQLHTFTLKDSVGIYGGFDGSESAISERENFRSGEVNMTVLSGNIGSIDEPTDNCYHVVVAPIGLDSLTALNGFTIKDGYADSLDTENDGGGMYIYSDILLENMHFDSCYASEGGALVIANCSPRIFNSQFTNNTAVKGGAVYCNNSDPLFVNVLFANNSAVNSGGALYNSSSSPVIVNATFADNTSNESGAISTYTGTPAIYNSIFWNADGKPEIFNYNASPTISHCNIKSSGGSASWNSTLGIDSGNNIDSDPKFVDTQDQDYRIYNTSPCIDNGLDSLNNENFDLRGNGFERILSVHIDMGAYEYKDGTDPVECVLNAEIEQQGNELICNIAEATYRWLDCNNNYSPIAEATNQNYTPEEDGSYAVEVSLNGCIDTSECFTVLATEWHNQKAKINTKIFPNPTTGKVSILLSESDQETQISVTDATGRMMMQASYASSDISFTLNGAPGIYLISIENKTQRNTYRIVKQ